jgi:DNA-binding CsgD family transcriptional regulator
MSKLIPEDPGLTYKQKHSKYGQALASCVKDFVKTYHIGRTIGDIHARALNPSPLPVEELQSYFKGFFEADLQAYATYLGRDTRIPIAFAVEELRRHTEILLWEVEEQHWRPVMKEVFRENADLIISGWNVIRFHVLRRVKRYEADLLREKVLRDQFVASSESKREAASVVLSSKPLPLPKKKQDLSKQLSKVDLTSRQRECMSLRLEYGLTETAIAKRLGVHRSTVREHLALAQAKFEQIPDVRRNGHSLYTKTR